MILRDYQEEALEACWSFLCEKDGHPLLVLPTGSGKSVIQAALVQRCMAEGAEKVLVLTHVKELIEQNAEKALALWPDGPIGIYSASVGRREHWQPVLYAGIQSIHNKLDLVGLPDIVIVDEAHLVPRKGSTMYRDFLDLALEHNPRMRVVGMSATPYRLDSGSLTEGEGRLFTDVAYELPIPRLIDAGHLVPLTTKAARRKIDMDGVGTRAGEFVAKDLDAAVHQEGMTESAIREIVSRGEDRRSWLVFCPSVAYAVEIRDQLRQRGVTAETVSGKTPKHERERILREFKAGRIRAITNCDVLTTGFDAPPTDMVVILRPTQSAALYVQMCGRGMRPSPETGKVDCLVLDFAGNVRRHGPVDTIEPRSRFTKKGREVVMTGAPTRECPGCMTISPLSSRSCEGCGLEFVSEREIDHETKPDESPILSAEQAGRSLHPTRWSATPHLGKSGKPSVRVSYWVGLLRVDEYVCVEHEGFARTKAERWWREHPNLKGQPCPGDAKLAAYYIEQTPPPSEIVVEKDGKYDRVSRRVW